MEKNKKTHFLLMLFISACFLSFGAYSYAEQSWDGQKSAQEAKKWGENLSRWEMAVGNWNKKREEQHLKLYGDSYNGFEEREYCINNECWSQDSIELLYKNNSGEVLELDIDGTDFMFKIKDRIIGSNENGGQAIIYGTESGEKFVSENFGQVMTYTNALNDQWNSENFGQVVSFKGHSGSVWKSENFGLSLTGEGLNENMSGYESISNFDTDTNDPIDDYNDDDYSDFDMDDYDMDDFDDDF